jgi:L-asparagine transporter-like permease
MRTQCAAFLLASFALPAVLQNAGAASVAFTSLALEASASGGSVTCSQSSSTGPMVECVDSIGGIARASVTNVLATAGGALGLTSDVFSQSRGLFTVSGTGASVSLLSSMSASRATARITDLTSGTVSYTTMTLMDGHSYELFLWANGHTGSVLACCGYANADFSGAVLLTPSASPVPVPAAVWLMISGLAGLVAVFRTRTRSREQPGKSLGASGTECGVL